MSWIKRLKEILVIFFISLVLLIILGAVSSIFMAVYVNNFNTKSYKGLPEVVLQNYDHMTQDEVIDLLKATREHGWVYEEVLGFSEKKRSTKFVNVNEFGVRSKKEKEGFVEQLSNSIWMFGGSTTFGYGVSDFETIPAILNFNIQDTVVLNLGRAYYFSQQENLFFSQLLRQGYRPKTAIFLDGVNERCSIDVYQKEMKMFFGEAQQSYTSVKTYGLDILQPSLELVSKVLKKLGLAKTGESANGYKSSPLECMDFDSSVSLREVVEHNLRERKSICREFEIACLTFVQPFPGVHGKHQSFGELNSNERHWRKIQFEHIKPAFKKYGAIFITDALEQIPNHAFIDGLHYSAESNVDIAKEIASHLAKNILPD